MSYLDVKDELIMKRPVLRVPVGRTKSERKKFFESEVKRFESIRAASCSYNTRKVRQRNQFEVV